MLRSLLPTSRIDQNASHGSSGSRKKMRPPLPRLLCRVRTGQAQVRFMDKRRGLQCLAGPFAGHSVRGESAEFIIDQGHQILGRCVTLLDGVQQLRDVAHSFWHLGILRTNRDPGRTKTGLPRVGFAIVGDSWMIPARRCRHDRLGIERGQMSRFMGWLGMARIAPSFRADGRICGTVPLRPGQFHATISRRNHRSRTPRPHAWPQSTALADSFQGRSGDHRHLDHRASSIDGRASNTRPLDAGPTTSRADASRRATSVQNRCHEKGEGNPDRTETDGGIAVQNGRANWKTDQFLRAFSEATAGVQNRCPGRKAGRRPRRHGIQGIIEA